MGKDPRGDPSRLSRSESPRTIGWLSSDACQADDEGVGSRCRLPKPFAGGPTTVAVLTRRSREEAEDLLRLLDRVVDENEPSRRAAGWRPRRAKQPIFRDGSGALRSRPRYSIYVRADVLRSSQYSCV